MEIQQSKVELIYAELRNRPCPNCTRRGKIVLFPAHGGGYIASCASDGCGYLGAVGPAPEEGEAK